MKVATNSDRFEKTSSPIGYRNIMVRRCRLHMTAEAKIARINGAKEACSVFIEGPQERNALLARNRPAI